MHESMDTGTRSQDTGTRSQDTGTRSHDEDTGTRSHDEDTGTRSRDQEQGPCTGHLYVPVRHVLYVPVHRTIPRYTSTLPHRCSPSSQYCTVDLTHLTVLSGRTCGGGTVIRDGVVSVVERGH